MVKFHGVCPDCYLRGNRQGMSQYDTVFEKNDGVSDLFKMFFFQVDF